MTGRKKEKERETVSERKKWGVEQHRCLSLPSVHCGARSPVVQPDPLFLQPFPAVDVPQGLEFHPLLGFLNLFLQFLLQIMTTS